MKHTLLSGLLLLLLFTASAQNHHNHEHHAHADAHKYHIGFGVAATHFMSEPELAPGVHVHVIRQLGHHNRWGLGLGYEGILDEHMHNSLNFLVNYYPLKHLSINAGPGMVFSEHDGENEILPAFHTEVIYEFNLGKFHIGPMAGFGIDSEDTHFSVGVHVGIGL
ncbi:MAG TPA: hypothetical protein ENN90_15735 [Mariniphaga anaerophila]|uniref:Outer membrane protein beta-barrel domain-containing protein n=1 Tax=Mariniphaga anaerophila TaxID=1484053 RepID=A0A831PLY2_9BACT|nr:hypothetical protein [Mariniphaga anaerophila]